MTGFARWAGVAAVGLLATAAPAPAQLPTSPPWPAVNPWGNGAVHGNPTVAESPFLGHLPTGVPVFNPWARPRVVPAVPALQAAFAAQHAAWNSAPVWNPALAPYWAAQAGWNANPGMQPGAFGPGIQPAPPPADVGPRPGLAVGPATQLEPGRFARVGPDLAINRTTGTVLRPYAGVALTAEGAFYRLPGSGTFTPWGAYIPGTGMFVNPLTGAAYNPQTGLILR